MAHPLTQHPPSSLPFATAARPSPVAFGFGQPSSFSAFSNGQFSTFGRPLNANPNAFPALNPPPSGSGSGSSFVGPISSSPSKRFTRPSPIGFKSQPTLKRTRKSSSSSESTPPSPRTLSSSPSHAGLELPRTKDDLSRLDLSEGMRGTPGRKVMKRFRSEAGPSTGTDASQTQDVGVLLATLPPSSHLDILMGIVRRHPALASEILAELPQPDLDECVNQLDKILSRIRRKTSAGVADPARVWPRIQDDVSAYCRTASTYVSFFSSSSPSPDPGTMQALLFTITSEVYTLLQLVPSDVAASNSVATLLELGKVLVSTWTNWVNGIATEVNQRGGMYPRSLVEGWVANIESLANWQSTRSLSSFGHPVLGTHPLVESFKSALQTTLETFINEVGWLIDRRSQFSAGPSLHHMPQVPVWSQPFIRPVAG
ncbi:hypothetical protein BD324DRAFT_630074 [Kockovaella imperatae]|uniref:Tethering factor for nuclear proteasome STS1 n=1 Tax=Kockovaella imperatae TaxID=4999 RepID=A0A1Y1UDE4_9TREE|nr:hypothetical protein BD324DRAFT_630074 [Kockovaella imperatae]ORX36078.1 hypothetical protein BD324DRAFT_630074 [Kockovaella imperatae]